MWRLLWWTNRHLSFRSAWSLLKSFWRYPSTSATWRSARRVALQKNQRLLPPLLTHRTAKPLPPPRRPLCLLPNRLPVPPRAPGCPPTIPPVLLPWTTTPQQRAGTWQTKTWTSASPSWCRRMLSATPRASSSPQTCRPTARQLSRQGLLGLQRFTPPWTLPAQWLHHTSCLQATPPLLTLMVSLHTFTFLQTGLFGGTGTCPGPVLLLYWCTEAGVDGVSLNVMLQPCEEGATVKCFHPHGCIEALTCMQRHRWCWEMLFCWRALQKHLSDLISKSGFMTSSRDSPGTVSFNVCCRSGVWMAAQRLSLCDPAWWLSAPL